MVHVCSQNRIISSNWEIWENQGWPPEEVTTNMTQKSVRV